MLSIAEYSPGSDVVGCGLALRGGSVAEAIRDGTVREGAMVGEEGRGTGTGAADGGKGTSETTVVEGGLTGTASLQASIGDAVEATSPTESVAMATGARFTGARSLRELESDRGL